MNIWK